MQKLPYQKNRRLRIFGGPNGSGKSTILNLISEKYSLGPYVNADNIEKELKKNNQVSLSDYNISNIESSKFNYLLSDHTLIQKAKKEGYPIDLLLENDLIINPDHYTHSYEAAFIADFLREELLLEGKTFAFETVMSHKSKLDFLLRANGLGYKNYLYYISTESPLINIERVKQRVQQGGHTVSEDKIESRYFQSLINLHSAVKSSYRSFIFDNSGDKANLILEVFNGNEITFWHHEIPHWVDKYLIEKTL